ncbi:uncharacterized protein LOC129596763 [Paramacrobiotus metropolitanus]|uniref:uncharacterized protein LOC129596763 n=1 Tax=Paramacrobiotus metropolitanus TaxID=2943436 RepID=UPI002445B28E|nr:uncharacterized protein LOC129596763 [Paramacrobiotus metropolitanus]
MTSQSQSPKSTWTNFYRWIQKPWKSLSIARQNKDALQVDPFAATQEAIAKNSNYHQILGNNLQPAVCELSSGQRVLGYVCDVDWTARRVLVDLAGHLAPRWLPIVKVQKHQAVRTGEIHSGTPVVAAWRLSVDQPYVFQPAQIIFPDTPGNSGPICVEVTPPGGSTPAQKFLHPIQLRIVPNDPRNHWEIDESLSVVEYCRLLQHQTALLDPGQDAGDVCLQHLMWAMNDFTWMKVVRIWTNKKCVHCVYSKNGPGFFDERDLGGLVRRSYPCRAIVPTAFPDDNTYPSGNRCASLTKLPYELQECILLDFQDVHNLVSAQSVCKTWYHILSGSRRNHHVTVDLANLTSDGRSHLLNVLDNAVTKETVSLTLKNGYLGPELDLFVFRFLALKVTHLPMIVLKTVRCFHVVAQNDEQKRPGEANLGHWTQACQVLHLRDVTIGTVFRSVAGLWYIADTEQADVVFVEKAVLQCKPGKAVRL